MKKLADLMVGLVFAGCGVTIFLMIIGLAVSSGDENWRWLVMGGCVAAAGLSLYIERKLYPVARPPVKKQLKGGLVLACLVFGFIFSAMGLSNFADGFSNPKQIAFPLAVGISLFALGYVLDRKKKSGGDPPPPPEA